MGRECVKAFVVCPDCGQPMSAHALLCRDCYKAAGGVQAEIYRAASDRGESSPRSDRKPQGTPKRNYTKSTKEAMNQ